MDRIVIQDIGRNFLDCMGTVWELHKIDSKLGVLTFTRRRGDNSFTLTTLMNGGDVNNNGVGQVIVEKLKPLRMRQSYEVDNQFYDNFGGKWRCVEYQSDRDLYKMQNLRTSATAFIYPTGLPALQDAFESLRITSRAVDRTVQADTAKQVYDAASAEFPNTGWNEGDYSDEHEENTTAPLDAVQKAGMKIMSDAFGKIAENAAGGPKYDGDKSMVQLLPPQSLLAVGNVLKFGAQKYEAHSWHKVENAGERYVGAGLRHILAHIDGETLDSESGLPHLAHGICSLMFVLELMIREQQGRGKDGSRPDGE